ncbi:MAG: bacteriophage abortive infection AbiH family protein [Clostridiales bacterium]|nr:bacteriophage abortive infection AbiH family protein [Clostridiales bacterium]
MDYNYYQSFYTRDRVSTDERSQNILVVGNGFDLYHGKKSGYRDFIQCVEAAFAKDRDARNALEVKLTELCNVNGFFRHFHYTLSDDPTWSYFEGEMKNIIGALLRFQDVVLENQRDPEYDLMNYKIISAQYIYHDLQVFKHFARIFEQVYDDPSGGLFKIRPQFITSAKLLDKKAVIAEVRRELDSFTAALDLYMETCVCGTDSVVKYAQIEAIAPKYVINMNYTDTVKAYGVPDEKIYYAKGRAGSHPSNLVLGSPETAEIDPDWVYIKNEFQVLTKFIGLPEEEDIFPADEEHGVIPIVLHFFGYSFPEGDDRLMQLLFVGKKSAVVYYIDGEDYAQKIIRLVRLFGKEDFLKNFYRGKISFEKISGD